MRKTLIAPFLILGLNASALGATNLNDSDTDKGRAIYMDRDAGHCLLCHRAAQVDAPFQGTLGPDLSNVGSRLKPNQIRAKIIDPLRTNPQSVMPAYHRTQALHQVAQAYEGKPILTAQQIEYVVAFVSSLKEHERSGADSE